MAAGRALREGPQRRNGSLRKPWDVHRHLDFDLVRNGGPGNLFTRLQQRSSLPSQRLRRVARSPILTPRRVPRFHPTGGRFLVKEYPKDREHRRLKLSAEIVANHHGLLDGGLPLRALQRPYAAYRADRRAGGKDNPRNSRRSVDTEGHVPRRWFRAHTWRPAVEAADVKIHVRPHDLRHAHASWLLAGGADLQVVKERLGHATIATIATIATTEQCLHTLAGADETALDALSAVRRPNA